VGSGSDPGARISKQGGTVFGFGKGKISISIQKSSYAPGDVISGNVALTQKKPVKAREVSISLIGTAWVTTYSGTRAGLPDSTMRPGRRMVDMAERSGFIGVEESTTKQRARVYEFKQQLDGEREYSEGREYHFEIGIPGDILSVRSKAQGIGPIKWCLSAKLDIPHGLDISKKLDITIK
jgi:sporulation-control protein spo0M